MIGVPKLSSSNPSLLYSKKSSKVIVLWLGSIRAVHCWPDTVTKILAGLSNNSPLLALEMEIGDLAVYLFESLLSPVEYVVVPEPLIREQATEKLAKICVVGLVSER